MNNKGMSLPSMMAIIFFLIGSVLALLSLSYNRAFLVEKNIKTSEEYVNSVSKIKAIQSIIARDQLTEEVEIAALASYFNIEYNLPNDAVYRFYQELGEVDRVVSGYLATSTTVVNIYDEVFIYTGTENNFDLSPMINATSLLSEFSQEYISDTFPSLTINGDFSSFDLIVDYYRSLTNDYYQLEQPSYVTNQVNPTINNHIFIDGDVFLNNKNLTIADGYVLVIDGNLYTDNNVNITGNIIINGSFIIDGKNKQNRQFTGTFYVNGDVEVARNTTIGTQNRPSFLIVNGDVTLENNITIYGYVIANYYQGQQGQNYVTGGIYTFDESSQINENNLTANPDITTEDLEAYAVTTTIIVESSSGELTFTYTEPRFE